MTKQTHCIVFLNL